MLLSPIEKIHLTDVPLSTIAHEMSTKRLVVDPELTNARVNLVMTNTSVQQVIEAICRDLRIESRCDPWGQVLYIGPTSAVEAAGRLGDPLARLGGSFASERWRACGFPNIWEFTESLNRILASDERQLKVSRIAMDNLPPEHISVERTDSVLMLDSISPRSLLWVYAIWWRARVTYHEGVLHVSWCGIARRKGSVGQGGVTASDSTE
jgi:hypothetical protein